MADIRNDNAAMDGAEAARKIGEAGVADETAAYTDAINRGEAKDSASESEAHPS